MIRTLKLNLILSSTILACVFLAQETLLLKIHGLFYTAPIFYFIIYTVQTILLNMRNTSPSMFVVFYNFSTFLKLVLSAIFLISYLIFFEPDSANQERLGFSIFFISLYFVYLFTNTVLTFWHRNEKK